MTSGVRKNTGSLFRPQGLALALEPRILFDGAAAVAVEQQHDNAPAPADSIDHHPAPSEPPASAQSSPRHLLVIDSRVENREQLVQQLPHGVKALVVQAGQDGLAAIEQALEALGQVDSIQILSHGSSGQFTLGGTTLSSDNVGQFGEVLQQWRDNLSGRADIQLYGCNLGAGEAGKTLVAELARWTGADVAASDDDTGATGAGGDWQLEVRSGDIDQHIALSDAALSGYDKLLANANPTTGLPVGSSDVLLGNNFTFTVNFTNSSSQTGFAPFIDLFLPATGKDGAGGATDDGVTFVSASYLGQSLVTHVITFDANGQATHPLAVDASGTPLVINAASFGMRAGDQLVVIELPFASVNQSQPTIGVQITAALSNLADTSFSNGTPELTIRARSGFQYGNDSLNNPASDPSLLEAGSQSFVVRPSVLTFDQTVITPEGETATGPNFERTLELTVTPASGQTLTDVVVTQPIPGNVIVTGITPGAGGTITSITLHDGRTSTNAAVIAAALALNNDADLSNDLYISSFTITYASLSGATSTAVTFFVPDADQDGQPVLNPVTGDDVTITFGAPSATGEWVPLDSRDLTPPATEIDFSGTGSSVSFVAKSITLVKEVSIQVNAGNSGVTPGDTLKYDLNIAISDYFAFGKNFFEQGQFTVADSLGDGQTLQGTPTLTLNFNGGSQVITLVTSSVVNANGTTSLTFDIGQSLLNAFADRGWLNGDLAFDSVLQGATTAVISYLAVVGQSYTPPAGNPHSEINEGDKLGNNATVTATILEDFINLTGSTESDDSSTVSEVPKSNIDIVLADLNDGGAPAPGVELKPGDEVTFRLSYDLVTGDYENLKLTAYLPLPLFDVSGISWQLGSGGEANVGQWVLGSGNTNADGSISVSNGAGNSVVFDLGSYVKANNITTGSRIEIEFTLRVGDQPFADNRQFDVLAQSSQTTTLEGKTSFSSADVAVIASIAEPVLNISHGVVSSSGGTVSGTTGTWGAPGTSGVPPFGVGNSVTDIGDINGSVSGIDGGDLLRLATAIENSGGGNAFDVATSITLPSGLSFVGGSLANANLQIYRGDGTLLQAGVDYSVSGNTITFVDSAGVGALLAGRSGTTADTSGANLVVITYDVSVSNSIAASRTLQSSASLTHYASAEGGDNFVAGSPLSDTAGQQVAAPNVDLVFAGGSLDNSDSSASHTTGANLVVGESMLYDIVVTLPEGTTQSLRIDDLIPPGMRLDTSFNGTGYQIITTAGGALAANFAGSISTPTLTGISGTLGVQDVDARFTFSAASASADNNGNNNSFVIRVRLVADNTSSNQEGVTRTNDARLTYSDPDGDIANGSTALERSVENTSTPAITVREPVLSVSQQLVTVPPIVGFDLGSVIDFTITIANNSGYDAFDITLLDNLPTQLDGLLLVSAEYDDGTPAPIAGFEVALVGGQYVLRSVGGANIDIAAGDSIVLTVRGTVNASANLAPNFSNTATAQWTSLDGSVGGTADPSGERTGVDGALNGGTLNDYRHSATLVIPATQGLRISRVGGLDDTPAVIPTNGAHEQATIGEIVRYRVVAVIPEGGRTGYQIRLTLDDGLEFIPANLNNVLVGLISDTGLTSSLGGALVSSGNPQLGGDENLPQAGPLDPALANSLTAVLNSSQISISADGRTVTFSFGNLTNNDLNDGNLEGVAIEFNVRVSNQASNQAGDQLGLTARDYVGNGTTQIGSSATLYEDIVEPGFTGMDKTVTAFNPNPSGATGTATVAVVFTQNGGVPAYNAVLTDAFPGGSGYSLTSITVGSTTYLPGALPADGISFSQSGGLTVNFDQLDEGTQVRVVYQVTVPNDALVAQNNALASLRWSSLPEDFTGWGGSNVGSDGGTSGERNGTGGVNDYVLSSGAGLGIIAGTLWNDTASATASTTPDGTGLAGQTVTLVWAGADGDLATTGDNATFTATTDSNGQYRFGVLPSGIYRIDVPTGTLTYTQPVGDLRLRIDSDGGTLGQVLVTLGEGVQQAANAGYVEQNDAPVNTVPGTRNGSEDTPLSIGGISVADVDADRDPNSASRTLTVTLRVLHGTLSLSSTPAGVSVSGANSAQMVLTGTQAVLNTALANLRYLGNLNYNGNDTLTVLTNDQGNFGDHDGDGIPGETSEDALTDQDSVLIVLTAVNDAPVAVNDSALATEAGGVNNGTLGVDPRGTVLANDTDVDIATNGDVLSVVSVTALKGAGSGDDVVQAIVDDGTVYELVGLYGTLKIDASGRYEYVVNNSNPLVQALRTSGQTLSESFSYTINDSALAAATATLTVTIRGANDTPVGVDNVGTAIEAGGVANGSGGTDATGNVLPNDTDVDSAANGETKRVSGVRAILDGQTGPAQAVPAGTTSANGTQVVGLYGTLHIGADGSYRYVINNSNATVQALAIGDTLTEAFTYAVTDAGGLSDLASLTITIQGNQDNPIARDDSDTAQAGSVALGIPEVLATGNVITDSPGTDSDVDNIDNPASSELLVNGIRSGGEAAGGGLTSVSGATVVPGLYGSLTINPDGSYSYDVDSNNATVRALAPGATINDVFTYRIVDNGNLTDLAQLTITISGVNDAPVVVNDTAQAVEAGGVNNQTPGTNPSGNVLSNDGDPDGDSLSVSAISGGTVGQALIGTYGTLTLNANGSYTYVVNNNLPAVQALRLSGNQLNETFNYTVRDSRGGTSAAQLMVVISGANDAPLAGNDNITAQEAGGTNNGTPGVDPDSINSPGSFANLLDNDSDVDAGDSKTINGIRTGNEAAGGSFTNVSGSQVIQGQYGTLTVYANGNYLYQVDNSLLAVQQLRPGQSLTDTFTYRMRDTAGLTDNAQLNVSIQGAWDAPVAGDNLAYGVAASPSDPGRSPTGNVITDSRFFPADSDIDQGDQLAVSGIRTGSEAGSGSAGTVGVALTGDNNYGQLTINADGSYSFAINSSHPDIQALGPGGFVTEVFTYEVRDQGGLTDLAQLTVIIRGQNFAPVGNDDQGTAIEAGGLNNATPGSDPSGNVLTNDTDTEGDALIVSAVRTGSEGGSGTSGTLGSVLRGQYGDLTLNADGTWNYVLDNDLPAVQALRISGQTLTDTFTYTVEDIYGYTDLAELVITIDGRNDTPIAVDDDATAVEAGGIANGTPGTAPTGNVLSNDTDVDSVANGETQQVLGATSELGNSAGAGQVLQGRYGTLTLNADGSYQYLLNNADPVVQALRTAGQTLREVFTYRMRDTAGLESTARLNVLIQGANDNPLAQNDRNVASDQVRAPQATGNVLPNDGDVDGGERFQVIGIRTGAEGEAGIAGGVGQSLVGRYGTLVINADGSYSYSIDMSNPEVLAAAGLGQVLQDVFTYTMQDLAGATDLAELVIDLDIAAPYIPPPDDGGLDDADSWHPYQHTGQNPVSTQLAFEPAIYVTPVVRANSELDEVRSWRSDGSNLRLARPSFVESESLEVPAVPGQFVEQMVERSRFASELDLDWILARQGRIDLTADGLLSDPSLFASDPADMTRMHQAPQEQEQPEQQSQASRSFQQQLAAAAKRLSPLAQTSPRS
ncbi:MULTISPECIES: VCBS domain-containing protein [unclassified Pseudomonas]|uniref:VCBS domain-containing protein n=1 Tax=unclassified Pseudomonas TaxID=196821 RepID=UPI00244C86D0|nr:MULTISPECIES: VCBS domain-containing protein [unclassified Pseudomonas]MDG9925675.1 VCBS domain-containing protein [Pseudomonas sp. GD04045]MDH0037208.1 VCBS domain-containing protein [Pseudomonas sp. GD04019]